MSIYFPLYDKYCGHTLYHSGLQYFESLHPTPRTPLSLLTAPFAPEVDHRCLESPGVMPSFRNLRAHPCHYFLLSSDIMVMMFGIWMYSSKLWCDNSDTLRTRFTKYGRCLWGFIDGVFLENNNFWLADK